MDTGRRDANGPSRRFAPTPWRHAIAGPPEPRDPDLPGGAHLRPGVGRRGFLTSAGLVTGALVAGGAAGAGIDRALTHPGPAPAADSDSSLLAAVAFAGSHQPGVVDRQPAHLRFLAFTLRPTSSATAGRAALRSALLALSGQSRALMAGAWPAGTDDIARGLRPAGLTVTVGIGAGALQAAGFPVPGPLAALPAFRGDALVAARTGGDLGLQLCGEDPMVVAAAGRCLTRAVAPYAAPRWSQGGFLRSVAGAQDPTATPRNLMGQIDGTDNPTGSLQDVAVWVAPGVGPAWMTGGSYLVARRIRMLLDSWEQLSSAAKGAVIGRAQDTGVVLSGGDIGSPPDFTATGGGAPAIPLDAHVRLTHPTNNGGARMMRRGYSFDDGLDATGQPDAGLFFQAFQTDPRAVFVPIQRTLSRSDALSRFIRHEGSAVFAVPPGASAGGFVGEGLFA